MWVTGRSAARRRRYFARIAAQKASRRRYITAGRFGAAGVVGSYAGWRMRKFYKRYPRARNYYGKSRRLLAKKARFSRRQIGERVGIDNAKHTIISQASGSLSFDRAMTSQELTDISQGTGENFRLRRLINMRGWKICMEFINFGTEACYLNVAVLHHKQLETVETSDFFGNKGYERAIDFGDPSLDALQYHCLPINTDNYVILRHKRYKLVAGTQSGGTNDLTGSNHMNLNWYVPLKRQLRYDQDGTAVESGQCWLVYWTSLVGTGVNATYTPVQHLKTSHKIVATWREPK